MMPPDRHAKPAVRNLQISAEACESDAPAPPNGGTGTRWAWGRRLVHIEKEPARPARRLSFAQLGHFAGLLAILATDRKRQGPKTALGNLVAALETIAECALFETGQRFANLGQRLRLHLNQGELDVVLDVRFGGFGRVKHALCLARGPIGPDVAHLLLDLVRDFTTTFLEDPLELGVSRRRYVLCLATCLHDLPPSPLSRDPLCRVYRLAIRQANKMPIIACVSPI